jgi:GNAT superfamily N-acetyltransferase
MRIRNATLEDYKVIYDIVHRTVQSVYPNYYLPEIVNFFLQHHNEENIKKDIQENRVYLMIGVEDQIVGTGTMDGRYIGRVYVLPEHHGKGYGNAIMEALESEIAKSFSTSFLDASLPSYDFYLKRGYLPTEYHKYKVDNERIMCYYVMEKNLEQPVKVPIIVHDNY